MRLTIMFNLTFALVVGCNADPGGPQPSREGDAAMQSAGSDRGGTLTVGEDHWTLVPETQCSIYSDNLVNIAGHAAEDPSVEIVIDYGGPTGVTIGTYGREPWWQAVRDSIKVEIEGRRKIRGRATFEIFRDGTKETAAGSFDITCF